MKKTSDIGMMQVPETPPGEDATSFEHHNKVIKSEYLKPKRARKMAVVNDLVSRSYAMRRHARYHVTVLQPAGHAPALPLLA